MLRLSTLYFLACHYRMKIWRKKNPKQNDEQCVCTLHLCAVWGFPIRSRGFSLFCICPVRWLSLSLVHRPVFFCSQNIGGRSTLLALEHDPPRPLSAHTSGSPHAAYRRWTSQEDSPAVKKVFTPLKHFLKQIKIIPAALKTHSQNQI